MNNYNIGKDKMTVKVLLTGAGGAGTIEIIRTLKETGRYRIIALDASPYAFGLKIADRGYVVPLVLSPGFEPTLEAIFEWEKPEFVIPLVDEEILLFHEIAPRFGAKVVAPTPEFCRMALDKWLTCRALRDAGVPVPETWLASSGEEVEYPAVIKPRNGRGSRELAYLDGPDDLLAFLAHSPRPPDDYIVQRQIVGIEYTVSVVVGLGEDLLAVVPKEVVVKRGITQVGVTRVVAEIDRLCYKIQEQIPAGGPFNVQLIMGMDCVPYVIEINPRYSTTVALTIAAGVNEVDIVIQNALGKSFVPQTFRPDLFMIRHYTQTYVSEKDWPLGNVTGFNPGREFGETEG